MTAYIKFRKRFILPIRYFFEERRLVLGIKFPPPELVYERLGNLEEELRLAQARGLRDEVKLIEARLDELRWVAKYGNPKT